jgi:tetratricopeptide (TPR) repeat protein
MMQNSRAFMGRVFLSLTVACLSCLSTTPARAVDPWKGARVLPKSSQVRLSGDAERVSGRDAGSIFEIAWPARVEKIDGQWILIRDDGGYSVPPVAGWVRKQDMLRASDDGAPAADGPAAFYATKIQEEPQSPEIPVLHWLRGIYWESQSQGEHDVAIAEYCSAIRFACGSQGGSAAADQSLATACLNACQACSALTSGTSSGPASVSGPEGALVPADAFLRLGRLLAQRQDSKDGADNCFACAEKLFPAQRNGLASPLPAQLYVDWGKAQHKKDPAQKQKSPDGANDAKKQFKRALDVNPQWSEPYYQMGEVALDEGKVQPSAGSKPPVDPCTQQQNLRSAIQSFNQAIRFSPLSPLAYRERGEALRLLAGQPACPPATQTIPVPVPGTVPAMPSAIALPAPILVVGKPRDNETLLNDAAYSADFACSLSSYRDARSLEVLANILADHGGLLAKASGDPTLPKRQKEAAQYYDQAADYANDAADFSLSISDRHRLLQLKKFCECYKKCLGADSPQPHCDCDKSAPRPESRPAATPGSFTPRPGRTFLEN